MTRRILIVKTSSMGDVLHTLPALTDAFQHDNDIRFDWVVEENFAQIPSWHFAVDRVIPVAIRRWRKNWFSKNTRKERNAFIKQLTEQKYDAIIDAQGLIKSAFLIARKANGIKHGFDKKSIREPIATLWYDQKHSVDKTLHAVERIRQLFAKSLDYAIVQKMGDYAIDRHFLADSSNKHPRYFVFLHSTTRDNKHWTIEQWRKLIELIKPTGYQIKLPWGAQHELERSQQLAEGFDHVEVLPKLSLAQVANELANAQAVVSVDTGLSHLTAALSRPNITLYGPTDPKLIGGYGKNQNSVISENKMMDSISANQVFTKLMQLV